MDITLSASQHKSVDFFASAPDELLLNIFSSLLMEDLCACAQVCRRWKNVSSDKILWRKFLGPFSMPKDGDIKKIFNEQAVRSLDKVPLKWDKFLLNMKDGRKGRFTVLFYHNPSLQYQATLTYGNLHPQPNAEFDYDVTTIVMMKQEEGDLQKKEYNQAYAVNDRAVIYNTDYVLPEIDHVLQMERQFKSDCEQKGYVPSIRPRVRMVELAAKWLRGFS